MSDTTHDMPARIYHSLPPHGRCIGHVPDTTMGELQTRVIQDVSIDVVAYASSPVVYEAHTNFYKGFEKS